MKNITALYFAGLWFILVMSGCVITKSIHKTEEQNGMKIPKAEREFRAAWVATVDNIDWPSKPGLTTEEQKSEIQAILDTAFNLNMNAIVLQVRPQCDALYESKLEPWSYYLTAEQGKAPEPYYDPLDFWIEEAHNRGMELHAWFNPYRAHHPKGGEITNTSVVKTRPGLAKQIGENYYWLDPAKKATQNYSFNVVMDVVRRYDIDGVHFDDYFYPYGDGSFPDDETWDAYKRTGGKMSRGDWRRDNVNKFIKRIYDSIKKEKKHVKFGLSPFGIWRPGHPESIKGFDQYDKLFADTRLWLNKGWVDYWTPQLYWPINQIPQSFPVLLGWWVNENKKGRNLWPGMFTSKIKDEAGVDENINQIMITRGFVPQKPGHCHFSMKALMQNYGGILEGLKNGPYRRQALVPTSPWLDAEAPDSPELKTNTENDSVFIKWQPVEKDDAFRYVLYYKYGSFWNYTIFNRVDDSSAFESYRMVERKSKDENGEEIIKEITIPLSKIMLTVIDRNGNESEPAIYDVSSGKVSMNVKNKSQ